ncbi:hypothetical protein F2Q69_00014007 [Brassica cretica]|uniref:Uncharacterized protein n=1 Tax=Brassica cretica TaxID=69181 RepID=A0A8S9R573_BRACR|nr:hypothetical protein F2Q69_00014007 [Brassica cretica]
MHGSSTCNLTCRSTRCRRICNRSMLIDTQGSRVSRRMNSSHAASHLDVYVSPCMYLRHSYSPTIKWRYRLELVQIHGFRSVEVLLDTPPGSPKNCPGAKGGSVRVQISPSRPVSVFMMKPRLCRSRDQSIPVKTFILGFGQVLSDQPAASRLEHWKIESHIA